MISAYDHLAYLINNGAACDSALRILQTAVVRETTLLVAEHFADDNSYCLLIVDLTAEYACYDNITPYASHDDLVAAFLLATK